MTAAALPVTDGRRRAMIAKVKIAQKELRLDDDTYRAVLSRLTGKSSAADCTEAQLARVLDEFKAKGWQAKGAPARKPASAPKSRPADHPVAKKARALWISLHQLGAVRDPSEAALEAFARRQLHVEKLQWADQSQGFRLIEALKAIAERNGWSQDVSGVEGQLRVAELKLRLANALKRRLSEPELGPGWLGHVEQLDQVIGISAARLRDETSVQT